MLLAAALLSSLTIAPPANNSVAGQAIVLGQSYATLTGPWRFHIGNDPAWSTPAFDDSQWEQVSLAAAPDAHDADVGLSGYVTGWGARGHSGITGFGWYRLHLHIQSPPGQLLAIAGPPAVDSAYQLFWNGQLIGSDGDFRGPSPQAFSVRPHMFTLTAPAADDATSTDVLAVRVWMGPWELADPEAGGIRIAPALGTDAAVEPIYQSEWIETLRGYIVEVILALGFACLCLAVWLLARFDRPQSYRWLYAAFLLTGAYRLNQAIFFWGQFESVPVFQVLSPGLLYPLGLAAWTLAWARLLHVSNTMWTRTLAVTTLLYTSAAQLQQAAFTHSSHPAYTATINGLATLCRIFYLVSTMWLIFRLARSGCRYRSALTLAIIAASVGQFAPELSQIGVPGIWFPFGTGVSRAQFAYAFFFVTAAVLVCYHLVHRADEYRGT